MTVSAPWPSRPRTAYASADDPRGRRLRPRGRHPGHRVRHRRRPADYAAAAVRDELRGDRPTVRTVVVEPLPARRALEVELHAEGADYRGRDRSAPPARRRARGVVSCPRCCRSTPAARSCTRATSSASTPGASTQAGERLEALGLSLDHAVTTFDYSTPETRDVYRRTHRGAKNRLGGAGVFPGAGGILMSRLHRPGVLVALDVTASRLPLTAVNPGWTRYETLTYTPGRPGRRHPVHERLRRARHGDPGGAVPRRLRRAGGGDVRRDPGGARRTPAPAPSSCCTCSSTSAPTATAPRSRRPARPGSPPRRRRSPRLRRAAAPGVPVRGLPDGGAAERMTPADRRGPRARRADQGLHGPRAARRAPRSATSRSRSATTTRSTPTPRTRGPRAPGVTAPPTLVCETNQYADLPRDDEGYAGHTWRSTSPAPAQVRGGNNYTFHRRIRPEDVVTATWRSPTSTEQDHRLGREMLVVTSTRDVHEPARRAAGRERGDASSTSGWRGARDARHDDVGDWSRRWSAPSTSPTWSPTPAPPGTGTGCTTTAYVAAERGCPARSSTARSSARCWPRCCRTGSARRAFVRELSTSRFKNLVFAGETVRCDAARSPGRRRPVER